MADMKPIEDLVENHFSIQEPKIQNDIERIKKTFGAKYEKANLKESIKEENHLFKEEQISLYKLLKKYKTLFDGTLGLWKGKPYNIELKPNSKPYHSNPFSIPKIYENILKLEVGSSVKLGVLKNK